MITTEKINQPPGNSESNNSPPSLHKKDRWMPFAYGAIALLNGLGGNLALVPVAIGSGIIAYIYPYIHGRKLSGGVKLFYLALMGLLVFAFFNLMGNPARAQFMQEAQTFFTASFGDATEAIDFTFNVLRGLYIIYLAIAFIGVFNSVRQDEDWVTAARTPIVVILVVTVADILTNLITGA